MIPPKVQRTLTLWIFSFSTHLQVPFLNLMSSLAQRGGRVNIRVGGNTQDYATLVASNSNGKMIQKQNTGNTNPVSLVLLLGAEGADV